MEQAEAKRDMSTPIMEVVDLTADDDCQSSRAAPFEVVDIDALASSLSEVPACVTPMPRPPIEALVRNPPAGALPARGPLSAGPSTSHSLLHNPNYMLIQSLEQLHPSIRIDENVVPARPLIPPYASAVPRPLLSFTLLSHKEFLVNVESQIHPVIHRNVLQVLKSVAGVRYDPCRDEWTCPIAAHDKLHVALQAAHAIVTPLPRLLLSVVSVSAEQLRRAKGEGAEDEAHVVLASKLPKRLFQSLAPFQRDGVAFAVRNEGRVFIADEMGLGKTVQALAVSAAYHEEWPVLVVSPSSARYHWRGEILQWLSPELVDVGRAPGTSPDVVIVESGDVGALVKLEAKRFKFMIVSFAVLYKLRQRLLEMAFKVVVVDESHYLKNPRARRTTALLELLHSASRAVLLSGTPALSRPMELFPQLHALQPKTWSDREAFGNRYCRSKESRLGQGGNRFSGCSNSQELHALLLGTIMIRRLKADIMTDLPAKERIIVSCEVETPELERQMELMLSYIKRYNKMKAAGQDGLFAEGVIDRSARDGNDILSNRDQVAVERSTADEVVGDEDRKVTLAMENKRKLIALYIMSGEAKVQAAMKYIHRFLADKTSGKLVVFGHHRGLLDKIASGLESYRHPAEEANDEIAPFDFIRIDGKTHAKQRYENVMRFQTSGSCRVALLSITAAGVAVTLTAASTVFFVELYWTPGSLLQAEDRVHRIGQTEVVKIHYLLAKNSIDEILWPLVRKKLKTLGQIFDGHGDADFHLVVAPSSRLRHTRPAEPRTLDNFAQSCSSKDACLKGCQMTSSDAVGIGENDQLVTPLENIISELAKEEEGENAESSDEDYANPSSKKRSRCIKDLQSGFAASEETTVAIRKKPYDVISLDSTSTDESDTVSEDDGIAPTYNKISVCSNAVATSLPVATSKWRACWSGNADGHVLNASQLPQEPWAILSDNFKVHNTSTNVADSSSNFLGSSMLLAGSEYSKDSLPFCGFTTVMMPADDRNMCESGESSQLKNLLSSGPLATPGILPPSLIPQEVIDIDDAD